MQSLKMWWMLAWRLMIVAAFWAVNVADSSPSSAMVGAIGFSLVPALVMGLAVRKSIRIFPLVRLVMRKPVVIELAPERETQLRDNPLLEPLGE